MKKIYLTIALAFTSILGYSQLSILDVNTSLPAASSYTIDVANENTTTSIDFEIHNANSNQVTVKVKRYLINLTSGHEIYYCFGANCYSYDPAPLFIPTQSSNVAAGGMLPNGQGTFGLKTDFDDFGVIGSSKVRYVLYDINNTADSVSLEITYNVTAVGLSKIDAKNFNLSNPMPNPANGNTTLKYNFASTPKTSVIKVFNMIGVLVKEIKVEGVEGKTQIDVSNLNDGVYFYSLYINGKTVSTKRLIVSK